MYTDEQRVLSLTRREMAVVFQKCDGNSLQDIALAIKRDRKTVQHYITKAYKKLNLQDYPDDQKEVYLRRLYCGIIFRHVKTFEDAQNWIPINPDTGTALAVIDVERREDEEEVEKGLAVYKEGRIVRVPPTEPVGEIIPPGSTVKPRLPISRRKIVKILAPILILGALILAGVCGVSLLLNGEGNTGQSQTSDQPPGSSSSSESEGGSITTDGAILFQDDFDGGMDSSWRVISGNPIVVNDGLTASEYSIVMIGDSSWVDYIIEFQAHDIGFKGRSDVGVRVQDWDNMYALHFGATGGSWSIVENGDWLEVPQSGFGNICCDPTFRIVVDGNELDAKMGDMRSTFVDGTYLQGGVIFNIAPEVIIDDVKITALP